MNPLWRTKIAVLTMGCGILGCTGQTMAGSWRGALPLPNADDCRIRLVPEGRFDISCRSRISGKTDEWVGAGKYETEGDQLTLNFVALAERGEVQRIPLPTIKLTYRGQGNTLIVKTENFESEWNRIWK